LNNTSIHFIVLSAECPSVTDEVSPCFQFGQWACNFA